MSMTVTGTRGPAFQQSTTLMSSTGSRAESEYYSHLDHAQCDGQGGQCYHRVLRALVSSLCYISTRTRETQERGP